MLSYLNNIGYLKLENFLVVILKLTAKIKVYRLKNDIMCFTLGFLIPSGTRETKLGSTVVEYQ